MIYLISEDSSKNALEVIKNILEKIFYHIEPRYLSKKEFFKDLLQFKKYTTGNLWKSHPHGYETEFIDFLDEIQDIIASNGFIFWHFDADEAWKGMPSIPTNPTFIKFQEKIIQQLIRRKIPSNEIERRIIPIVPFYSIESWLFPFIYHFDKTLSTEFLKTFTNYPDEILQIKDTLKIKDSLNLKLSSKLTVKSFNYQASFHENLENIKSKSINDFLPRRHI